MHDSGINSSGLGSRRCVVSKRLHVQTKEKNWQTSWPASISLTNISLTRFTVTTLMLLQSTMSFIPVARPSVVVGLIH